MDITKDAFETQYREALDTIVIAMTEHPEIDPKKFFAMACLLENMSFFGPVLYAAIKKKDDA